MGRFGYEPLQHSIPAVLGCLSLLTRAFVSTKTLRTRISLFFLEKLLQEAPFGSESVCPGPLDRALTTDEAREVTHMARRIAAIVLLYPALDANYLAVKQATIPWPGISKNG